MASSTIVASLPDCDFCKDGTPAQYDAKTVIGPWAYMCSPHFDVMSVGVLGTGFGQRLVVAS